MCCLLFFCFKQKTAYEMRISDWSSDVCSSDLVHPAGSPVRELGEVEHEHRVRRTDRRNHSPRTARLPVRHAGAGLHRISVARHPAGSRRRSEEHTSELQSLMRISYAVFCLKKKKKTN